MEEFRVFWVIGMLYRMSTKKISYIDENILYVWAMSQSLPIVEFKKLPFIPNNYTNNYNHLEQIVEDFTNTRW